MKILITIYDELKNPFYGGGGAMLIHELAKRLTSNHEVEIVCGKYPGSSDYTKDDVVYKHIGGDVNNKYLSQIVYLVNMYKYIITESEADVIVENFIPPHSTSMLPLFTKTPVVGMGLILHAKEFSKKYRLPFYLIEQIGLSTYKNVVVLSKYFKDKLESKYSNIKAEVFSPGLEKEFFNKRGAKGDYVLFIGRPDIHQKGIDLLLESWTTVKIDGSKLKLVIAGINEESDRKKLKAIIKENNIEDSVKIVGWVKGAKKLDLIANSFCMVCPSRFETFGISALEALALGKPLVTFDIPGFSWIPKNKRVVVKSFDTVKYAKQIAKLSKDTKTYNRLSKEGKSFSRGFTWEKVSKDFENLLVDLVAKNKQVSFALSTEK